MLCCGLWGAEEHKTRDPEITEAWNRLNGSYIVFFNGVIAKSRDEKCEDPKMELVKKYERKASSTNSELPSRRRLVIVVRYD